MRLTGLLLIIHSLALAQSPTEVIERMQLAYNNMPLYSCEVEYFYFDNKNDPNPQDSMQGTLYVSGDTFSLLFGRYDIVSDGIIVLQIDSASNKIALYQNNNNTSEQQFPQIPQAIINLDKQFIVVNSGNEMLTLRCDFEENNSGALQYLEFTVNTNTWLLVSMRMQYQQVPTVKDGNYWLANPLVEVRYSAAQQLDASILNQYLPTNWVAEINGEYQLQNSAQHFELIK
jgi:hypothetical protein